MIKKWFWFCMLWVLATVPVMAQDKAVVMGLVRDAATRESLPGVNVVINGIGGTVTDSAGRYTIQVDPGKVVIAFRYIGYTTQEKSFVLAPAEARIVNIDMYLESMLLNTVVVSAGKFEQKLEEVTVSMSVIKPQLIENTNAISMDAVMEQVPGVTVIDGQANIRGGSGFSYGAGSRVLMLVDDLPMLAADANDVKWSHLPVEIIDQVEVIKGASSALFGSSAMNGVVNVRTAYPKAKPETRVNWFTGWYDDPEREQLKWWGNGIQTFTGLSFSHLQQIGHFDLVLGGNVYGDDGYRQGETEKRYRLSANTRYRFRKVEGLSVGINSSVTFTEGGNFLLWQNDSSGAYLPMGGLADTTTTLSNYETTRTNIDPYLTYTGKRGGSHKLRTRYYKSANRNDTQQGSFATNYFGEYQYQRPIGGFVTATVGVSELYSDVKSELYQDHTSNNFGIFMQLDGNIGKLKISAGGRLENYETDNKNKESIPVLRMGVNYQIAKHTFFRASYGQGYRYPSIAEKFIRTQVGNIVIYPNDSIESETGWTAEAGFKQGVKLGGWQGFLDVAGFWSEYQDMMEFTFGRYGTLFDPLLGFGFQSVNIGNTRIAGIDVELVGDGNLGRVPVTLLCGYTWIDPIQLDFDPEKDTVKNSANYNVLKYRYRHTFKGDIEFNPGDFLAGMSVRYNSFMENVDAVFESDGTIPGVKHYRTIHDYGDWVVDLRLGYRVTSHFRFLLNVKNLFNHEYMGRPADMQPPRSYTIQFDMRI
jgi:iron complex outermembrane receptor protein